MESHLEATTAGKDGRYSLGMREIPRTLSTGALFWNKWPELEPQSPQSCEQLETGHPEVYQEARQHSKYVEVRAVAKKECRRSRGIRPPRAGQATRLG